MNEYNHLTDAQWNLYSRMSEISEEDFCAGWMIDNEFRIWDALHQRATEQTNYISFIDIKFWQFMSRV